MAAASCLVAGLILGFMGVFRMGFLTAFMSKSFIGGFTFSAACHIFTSQVHSTLVTTIRASGGFGWGWGGGGLVSIFF
jgi:sulfate anion transporter 2